MKYFYQKAAILFLAIVLTSAQGVEAQKFAPKTKQPGKNKHYGNNPWNYGGPPGQKFRGRGRGDRHHGHNRKFDNRGRDKYERYGRHHRQIILHRGRRYMMSGGVFFRLHYGRWLVVDPPVGLRVAYLPHESQARYTRHGDILFICQGTYYMKARRGPGYVVVEPYCDSYYQRGHHDNRYGHWKKGW